MKRLSSLALLFCLAMPAAAAPARVWWPGWDVASGEELWQGIKYSVGEAPRYPLSRLFDGDPATAWVHSARDQSKDTFASRRELKLTPARPVAIDGLRLMNGQNQSRARFRRNDRVTRIRVLVQTARGTLKREFALADSMGWHSVKFPRSIARSVTIQLTGIKRGAGPGNDICISELALLNGGAPVGMHMPRAVMFYNGLEGCGASRLILKNGESLDGIATDAGFTDKWSSSGRYVSGYNGGGDYIWIADAWRGEIVKELPGLWSDYQWAGPSTLKVTPREEGKQRKPARWLRI